MGNLEWVSRSQNIRHAAATGLLHYPCGSAKPTAKLTEDFVRQARVAYRSGTKIRTLAYEYCVNPSTMSLAVRGKTWCHVV